MSGVAKNTVRENQGPAYHNAADANREFAYAAWWMWKESEKDLKKRARCCGCMPSHCYNYEPYNEALANFHKVALRAWSQLTTRNRVYALGIAQDDCNGCPSLLEPLHELLVNGPVEASPYLPQDDPMAHAESAIEKLKRLYKGKKLRRREEGRERYKAEQEAKRSKRKRGEEDSDLDTWDYDSDTWEVETDDEEWDNAGFPFVA